MKMNKFFLSILLLVFLSVSVLGIEEYDGGSVAYYSADYTNYNQTILGTPFGLSGVLNGQIDFDGTNDAIGHGDILDSVFVGSSAQFTITTNFNLDVDTTGSLVTKLADTALSESQRQFNLRYQATSNKPEFLIYGALDGSSYEVYTTNATININTDYQLITLVDMTQSAGSRVTFYVNNVPYGGVLSTSAGSFTTLADGTAPLSIGASINTAQTAIAYVYNGQIDDTRIYDKLLTSTEITTLYEKTDQEEDIAPANLVFHSTMDFLYDYDNSMINGETIGGTPTETQGNISGAIDFDGVGDYITGDSISIDGTSLTFGGRIKTDDTVTTQKIFSANVGTEPSFNMRITGDDFACAYVDPVDDLFYSFATTDNSLTTGWHSFYCVFTAGTGIEAFVDGSSVGSDTTGSVEVQSPTSATLNIGRDNRGLQYFNGKLDDLRIYNTALTLTQISTLHSKTDELEDVAPANLFYHNTMNGLDDSVTNNGASINTEGILGSAYSFDGINDYLETNYIDTKNSAFSFSGWVYHDTSTKTEIITSNNLAASTESGFSMWVTSADVLTTIGTDGLGGNIWSMTSSTNLNTGSWYHIVLSWTGDTSTDGVKLYLDGVSVANTTASGTQSDNIINEYLLGAYSSAPDLNWDGLIDEFSYWNRALTQTEILELYASGAPTTQQQYPYTTLFFDVFDEIVGKTIFGEQIGTVTISGSAFTPILSADFNITTNNTPIYMTTVSSLQSNQDTIATCRILITGDYSINSDYNSTFDYSISANEITNMKLNTHVFVLENGSYNAQMQCQKNTQPYTVFNTVAIGHLLLDEQNNTLNYVNNHKVFSTNNSGYVLKDSFNITINDTVESEGLVQALVIDWVGEYTNNDVSLDELGVYIDVNGSVCGEYLRDTHPSTTSSVSGGCVFKNVTPSDVYTINTYAKGVNADFHIETVIKNHYSHVEERGGVQLNGTQITSTSFQDVASFNVTIKNHADANFIIRAGIPHISDNVGNITVRLHMQDGTINFTSPSFTRSFLDSHNHMLSVQYLVPNIPSDNYTVILQATTSASLVNITGGDLYGYMTDSKAISATAFNVTVLDYYDNSGIDDFSAILSDGTIFSTTLGYVLVFTNLDSENLTITSDFNGGYFSSSITNHNTSLDLTTYMNQTLIGWDCVEKVSGNNLNCSSPLESTIFNYNVVGNPYTQSVNVTGYYETFTTFNVTALQSEVFTATPHYSTNLSLQAISELGTPTSCIYNITGVTYPTYSENITGAPNSSVGLINGSYSVLADCEGYAYQTQNITIENITQTLIFDLFTTNSIQLNFYDILTRESMNGTNISVQFIGTTAQTIITSEGVLYVDLVSPDEYTIIFDADTYRQGSYIFTLINKSYNEFDLYMQPVNDTQLLLITVKDTYGNYISNAEITIQRYSNNSWVTEQIRSTDFQGRTEAYFVLSTIFYNFLVSVDGVTYFGILNNDANKKQIYAEDVTNGVDIIINRVNDEVIRTYQSLYGITNSLTYVNTSNTTGYFRFAWDDSLNEPYLGLLEVYKDGVLNCSSSATTESGIVYCHISENGTAIYNAISYLDGESVGSLNKRFVSTDSNFFKSWGALGYALLFLAMVLMYFLYLESPSFSLYAGSVLFSGCVIFGLAFSEASLTVISLILALTSLVAGFSSKTGGNG